MNDANKKRLLENYPNIFSGNTGRLFEHGDGWFQIIDELCIQLNEISKRTGIKIVTTQTKEKFGTYRHYLSPDFEKSNIPEPNWNIWASIINGLIHSAESQSAYICEICGACGYLRNYRWVRTLCDNCDFEHQKNRIIEYMKSGTTIKNISLAPSPPCYDLFGDGEGYFGKGYCVPDEVMALLDNLIVWDGDTAKLK